MNLNEVANSNSRAICDPTFFYRQSVFYNLEATDFVIGFCLNLIQNVQVLITSCQFS
jgi:hypothetical protein